MLKKSFFVTFIAVLGALPFFMIESSDMQSQIKDLLLKENPIKTNEFESYDVHIISDHHMELRNIVLKKTADARLENIEKIDITTESPLVDFLKQKSIINAKIMIYNMKFSQDTVSDDLRNMLNALDADVHAVIDTHYDENEKQFHVKSFQIIVTNSMSIQLEAEIHNVTMPKDISLDNDAQNTFLAILQTASFKQAHLTIKDNGLLKYSFEKGALDNKTDISSYVEGMKRQIKITFGFFIDAQVIKDVITFIDSYEAKNKTLNLHFSSVAETLPMMQLFMLMSAGNKTSLEQALKIESSVE